MTRYIGDAVICRRLPSFTILAVPHVMQVYKSMDELSNVSIRSPKKNIPARALAFDLPIVPEYSLYSFSPHTRQFTAVPLYSNSTGVPVDFPPENVLL